MGSGRGARARERAPAGLPAGQLDRFDRFAVVRRARLFSLPPVVMLHKAQAI
jgi:hypothetical protein